MTIKDSKYVKINGVNPLYLIINKVNGYFEQINGNKYLALVLNNENKKKQNKKRRTGEESQIFNEVNN